MVGHTSVRRLLLLGVVPVLENMDVDKRDSHLGIPRLSFFPIFFSPLGWLFQERPSLATPLSCLALVSLLRTPEI